MPPQDRLAQFAAWVKTHITGDEKGEAQIFLDHLFQAFGWAGGLKEAGATLEMRVSKADQSGTAFADLVWKPVVLVEMKKRGADLLKHYRQAFDYWTRITGGRPRFVVLCNFDEFWIYDFDSDLDAPKDKLAVTDLPDRWGPLAFLAPGSPAPKFLYDREAVTRQAADKLATLFTRLIQRGIDRSLAQRFTLQMLIALFAEDIDLLPRYFVGELLEECATPADTYDLLGNLFQAMNTDPPVTGGRFKGVRYFNGGLFAEPARVELTDGELVLLRETAKHDWSKVQPEIFGTFFEHSVSDPNAAIDERRAFGMHFTRPTDIMKIVGPTIVTPWKEQIDGAKTLTRLHQLLDRLQSFRVLDPACGSGNFLYLAYRELKRLEATIYERIDTEFPSRAEPGQVRLSFLSARNFFGLDINPLAVEIAKVAMMVARKLAIDELHITEQPLPLHNLDKNFVAMDALVSPEGQPASWPSADVIIGNPPFIGSRYLAKEHGYDYARKVYDAFPDVPKMADYCVYWFRKAHDHLPACIAADPVAGRAGLVGTQNIRNGGTREAGLDYIVRSGAIVEAVENQPWSGEANVHVSIANWVKTQDPALLPKARKLWHKVEPVASSKRPRKRGAGSASKEYELDYCECQVISASLSDEVDLSTARALSANTEPKCVYVGQYPFNEGFWVTPEEAQALLASQPECRDVLFPYMIGRDLVDEGRPTRWIIDFGQRNVLEAMHYPAVFERVKLLVMPVVLAKAEQEKAATGKESTRWTRLAKRWWQLRDQQPGTIAAISRVPRYIACSRVTKRPIFEFLSSAIRPDNTLMVFPFADDYSFGVLQSSAHWQWFVAKCSKLKSDFRYTGDTVFDTFPWPQLAGVRNANARVEAVVGAAREVRRVRAEALAKLNGGLRALYRTLEFPGANPLKDAQAALDAAVVAAYGFSQKQDLPAQLLALNLDVAAKIDHGQAVTAPGVPAGFTDSRCLISNDRIEAPEP